MGKEYKLRFEHQSENIGGLLRSLPFFAEFDEEWASYCYRTEDNMKTMPSVEIRIEDDGIYLCDYGASMHLFGSVVTEFVSRFGRVQIEDYEP